MVTAQGCFYLGPPWNEPENRPPVRVKQMPEGDEILLTTSQQNVWVQAVDPDGDSLFFTWWVNNQIIDDPERVYGWEQEGNNGTLYNTRLTITPTSEPVGSTVLCFVTDGGVPLEIEWSVVQ